MKRLLHRFLPRGLAASLAFLILPLAAQGVEISDLIADLSSSDVGKRREAAYQLNQLGPEAAEAVPALIKALEDEEQVFFHAVTALARIGPKAEAAIPALIEGLGGGSGRRGGDQRQIRSAFALSRIGAAAVPALRQALCERDEGRCANAAEALALMPPETSAPATEELLILLGDERERVQASVIKALATHGAAAVPRLTQIVQEGTSPAKRDAIRTLGLIGRDAHEGGVSIAAACREGNPEIVVAALEAMARVRHDEGETTALIVKTLAGDDAELWDAAANAALLQAQLVREFDTQPFAAAMNGASEPVRLRFADVLGRIGPAAAPSVPEIVASAAGASLPDVAGAFAAALSRIGEPAASPVIAAAELIPAVDITEDSWFVKAVAGIGMPSLPSLIEGLKSPGAGSRAVSVTGIGLLGAAATPAAEKLFSMLEDQDATVRGLSLVALPRIGAPAARMMPLLEPLAADESELVRSQAYRAMGSIKENPERILPILVKGAGDPSTEVQASAIAAIGKLGPSAKDAVPALIKLLDAAGPDTDAKTAVENVERAAILALGEIGAAAEAAVPSLASRAGSPDVETRLLALAALRSIGESARAALPAVRIALGDRMPEVRVEAVEAVTAIETDPGNLTEMLLRALQDDAQEVKTAAIAGISALGEKAQSAAPGLFALLSENEDIEPKPILDALRGLRVRDLDLYLGILHHKSPSVRLFACEALGRFGSRAESALPELRKLEKDEYDFVRRRATQAIARIEQRN